MADLVISRAIAIPEADLEWTAVRASGPGGQNVNKVATKVEIRFDVDGTEALTETVKKRLRKLPGTRFDAEGRLIIVSQATRSQSANLEDARSRLVEIVKKALHRPKKRKPTKPSRRAQQRRLSDKKKHSEKKQQRRRSFDDG